MFARLGAKLVFATAAIAVVFFGVGLIGLAIATALTPYIGAALGYGVAGAILLLPPLLGAVIASSRRPRKPSLRRRNLPGSGEPLRFRRESSHRHQRAPRPGPCFP